MACFQVVLVAALAFGQAAPGGAAQSPALTALAQALEGPRQIASGQLQTFTFELTVELPPEAQGPPAAEGQAAPAAPQTYRLKLARRGAQEFSLSASDTPLGPLALVRTNEATAIVDHAHKRVFLGTGKLPDKDALEPGEFARRLAAAHGDLASFAEMMQAAADSRILAMQMVGLMKLVEKPGEGRTVKLQSSEPTAGRVFTVTLVPEESRISSLEWSSAQGGGSTALATGGRILYSLSREARLDDIPAEGYARVEVERAELERSLLRGLPRGVEILYRRDHPRPLRDRTREAAGGKLVIRDGRRICFLRGSPQEIGRQHGELLAKEVRATVDGVLYAYGLKQSLAEGTWLLAAWRKNWAASEAGIPQEYKDELAALAEAGQLSPDELQMVNIAAGPPEAAGFAALGQATKDGQLYQGGMFYWPGGMGLREQGVLFVVEKKGARPLVGLGLAGLIAFPAGMNAAQLAVECFKNPRAEDYRAEQVPRMILTRLALERTGTLDEALKLLAEHHEVCKYALVVGDGKVPDARAVFIPLKGVCVGKPRERWVAPEYLPWASRGGLALPDRLCEGFKAALQGDGDQLDEALAMKMMVPPGFAMGGQDLLNVLFEPRDLVFHVATARGKSDAWQEPYVRYDLKALLAEAAGEAQKEETSKP